MEGSLFLGFSQEGKQVYSVQAGKFPLYWKGLQSSHTILGQLSRAFQLDGSVGIAAECHSWCPGWSVLLPFAVGCSVVHPQIGILAIVADTDKENT